MPPENYSPAPVSEPTEKKYTVILNHWEYGEWLYYIRASDAKQAEIEARNTLMRELELDTKDGEDVEIRYIFEGHLIDQSGVVRA